MFCKNCGEQINEDARFCKGCGFSLVAGDNADQGGGDRKSIMPVAMPPPLPPIVVPPPPSSFAPPPLPSIVTSQHAPPIEAPPPITPSLTEASQATQSLEEFSTDTPPSTVETPQVISEKKSNVLKYVLTGVAAVCAVVVGLYFFIGKGGDKTVSKMVELRARVNTDGSLLNLRTGASTDSEVLYQLPNGTEVIVLERTGRWTKIEFNTIVGYVSDDFLLHLGEESGSTDPIHYLIRDNGVGVFILGQRMPTQVDGFQITKERIENDYGDEGYYELYKVYENRQEMLVIFSELFSEGTSDIIERIYIKSAKFKTAQNIGINSTIEEFVAAYPDFGITDGIRLFIYTRSLDGVIFSLGDALKEGVHKDFGSRVELSELKNGSKIEQIDYGN